MMDMHQLEAFGVYRAERVPSGIRLDELLKKETCLLFLDQYRKDITAPNLAVAASLFMKQYARKVVASTLYSLGVYNCTLSLPIQACTFSKERKLCVQEGMCQWQEWVQSEREAWRETVLRDLFSSHVTPMIDALHHTTGLSSAILWENVAIRVNSVYRKTLASEENEERRKQLASDFYFLKQADGTLFRLKRNPMKSYLKLANDGSDPYRRTCCLYHRLKEDKEGIGYCGNCPIRKSVSYKK